MSGKMSMLKKIFLLALFVFTVLPVSGITISETAEKYRSGLVDVVYSLQYNKHGSMTNCVGLYCPSCRDFHHSDLSVFMSEQRDLQVTGYLVGEQTVLVPDLLMDPDMIKNITVKLRNEERACQVVGVYPAQGMIKLQLSKPFDNGKVLKFAAPGKNDRYFAYSRIMEMGRWTERLQKFDGDLSEQLIAERPVSQTLPGNALVINSRGEAVAVLGNSNEIIGKAKWYENYSDWQMIPYKEFTNNVARLEKRLQQAVFPVTVQLKEWKLSRREKLMGISPVREWYGYIYKLPDGKIVLPLLATPKQHSLIEKITVHFPQGDVDAIPIRAMKNYGMILLKLAGKVDFPAVADTVSPLQKEMGQLVFVCSAASYPQRVELKIYTDCLGAVTQAFHNRHWGFLLKKRNAELVFSLNGALLGINADTRVFNYSRTCPVISAAEFEKLLSRTEETPVFKAMCNPPEAVGFFGVEYQALNREIARSVMLEHLTSHGREGLLISYVYPGSTAEKLGLKVGDVLLKLIPENGGKPIELTGKKFAHPQDKQFPWDKLDGIPEMYFGDIPEPWRGIKDKLSDQLTTIGIGRKIDLIAIQNGKLVRKDFTIENAPHYFEIAPAFRAPALGIEVRDITFEVRRYFRMNDNDPGVIISEVFAGRAGSVAGLRPFEIITAVNDKSVNSPEAFKKALEGASEIRLTVRRLASNRVVTVKIPAGPRR